MVVTREVTYDVDGLTMVAHLARPDGKGPWPSVLIGHDGIGLDDYQRGRADALAERGYLALAMDYHAGRTFFGDPQAMLARVMPLMADPVRMQAIGRAALDVLLAVPGADHNQLAALGFGAGEPNRAGTRPRGSAIQGTCRHPSGVASRPRRRLEDRGRSLLALHGLRRPDSALPINCSRSPARFRAPK